MEVKALVEYKIAKANQNAPEKPTYTVSADKAKVSIDKLEKDTYEFEDDANKKHNAKAEYCLTYYDKPDAVWHEYPNTGALEITMDNAYTTYIVAARYQELEDYNASEITRADAVYFFAGDVKVIIICDDGIDCKDVVADGGDPVQNGISLTLKTDAEYYLVSGDYDVDAELKLTSGVSPSSEPTVEKKPDTNGEYSVKNIQNSSTLTITIGTTRKAPQVTAQVAPRQIFSTFTGTAATISRDSAFTAAFQITNYDPEVYTGLNLTFDAAIPVDSTVILLDRSNGGKTYWYYRAEEAVSSIELTKFKKMGGTESHGIPTAGTNGYIDLSYQFIVDFSQSGGYSPVSLTMLLEGVKKDPATTHAPDVKADVNVSMKNSTFDFQKPMANGLTNSFTCTFNKGADASKWENRASALVLMIKDGTVLPPDAYIKAEVGGTTTNLYKSVAFKTEDSKNVDAFIIPMSLLKAEETVNLTLNSDLFPTDSAAEYALTAQWWISPSKAGKAPMTGDQVGSTEVTFTSPVRTAPSLKIEGRDRVLPSGGTLKVNIEKKHMDGCTISAALLRKAENGVYNTTGWNKEEVKDRDLTVQLGGQTAGSYCLMLTVKRTGSIDIELEVPYYFIIKPVQ